MGVGSTLLSVSSIVMLWIRSPGVVWQTRVAQRDLVEHLFPFDHLAKDRVHVVEPVGGRKGDEELAAVGAGARIGHGQQARTVEAQAGIELIPN